ncbi:MAG TPA: cytochrome c [Gemmatales bacterium]|nr:cytochrome c [Gemmatales bacterium]
MKRGTIALAGMACLLLVSGLSAFAYSDVLEEIMEKGFKKGGVRHQISMEIEKENPDWAIIAKKAKEFTEMCEKMCKEKQPQGEEESWKKLTESLAKEAKSLTSAAERKDLANAKAAITKINGSCKECHDAHRP